MNIWFTRFVLFAMALALLAAIFSIVPLEDKPKEQPEGVIVSPDAPPSDGEVHPPENLN